MALFVVVLLLVGYFSDLLQPSFGVRRNWKTLLPITRPRPETTRTLVMALFVVVLLVILRVVLSACSISASRYMRVAREFIARAFGCEFPSHVLNKW
jgi:hypothetical protein